MTKPTYDPIIMDELLNQKGIREKVAQMRPETLAWYKDLLVSQGIYVRYVSQRQDAQIKKMVKDAFGRGEN